MARRSGLFSSRQQHLPAEWSPATAAAASPGPGLLCSAQRHQPRPSRLVPSQGLLSSPPHRPRRRVRALRGARQCRAGPPGPGRLGGRCRAPRGEAVPAGLRARTLTTRGAAAQRPRGSRGAARDKAPPGPARRPLGPAAPRSSPPGRSSLRMSRRCCVASSMSMLEQEAMGPGAPPARAAATALPGPAPPPALPPPAQPCERRAETAARTERSRRGGAEPGGAENGGAGPGSGVRGSPAAPHLPPAAARLGQPPWASPARTGSRRTRGG